MSQLPPRTMEYAAPQMYSREFVPSHGRARLARIFLWISIGVAAVTTAASIAFGLLVDIEQMQATNVVPSWFWPFAIATGVIGLISFILVVVVMILYLRWQYQAQCNLYAIGRTPEYTPGWGVGYWFIPIMNLFRPYQNLKDLTSKSHPDLAPFPTLGLYWTCWLCSNIVANISGRVSEVWLWFGIGLNVAAFVCQVVAAVLLVKLMNYVVEGQAAQTGSAEHIRAYR